MSRADTDSAGKTRIALSEAGQDFRARLRQLHHRGLVWLSGDRSSVQTMLGDLLDQEAGVTLWYGENAPDGVMAVEARGVHGWLGAECDTLVFDAWQGFDPDAFGVLSGTLRGGGLLFLLTPPPDDWPRRPDRHSPVEPPRRYLQRLAAILKEAPDVLWVENGTVRRIPELAESPCTPGHLLSLRDSPCLTVDQRVAVAAVMHVATGHRRRPVVLCSDRGRGKSAAFGIAAARLIVDQGKRILVTAARRSAVDALMRQANAMLSPEQRTALSFVAPDALAQQPKDADLLLVDEAAAIPAPLLEILLKRYSRIAFATTVHGYEGTGRGFALRFNEALDRHSNSWKTVSLQTPIRWAPADPLEALVFRLLMLDATAVADDVLRDRDNTEPRVERVDRDQLAQDEFLLRELFGLLVLAHYKTRPSDLRQLLDAPSLSVYMLRRNGHVVAAALISDEGGFNREQAAAITAGLRRPVGHLLPETLAIHLGLVEAPLLRAARVIRIAVHPAVQGQGLGSLLLTQIGESAGREGFDYLGASFGASTRLLRFWKTAGLQPVRVGERRSASSGSHSVVVMQALSEHGERLFTLARERFLRHFPHQLSDSLRALEAPLVIALMRDTPASKQMLTADDLEDVRHFACERRFLESAIGALWPWLCNQVMSPQSLDALEDIDAELLIARILQKQDWTTCALRAGLGGHDQALARLRDLVRQLMDRFC